MLESFADIIEQTVPRSQKARSKGKQVRILYDPVTVSGEFDTNMSLA